MSNQEKEKFKILIDKHKSKMPWYILEYAEIKNSPLPCYIVCLHY